MALHAARDRSLDARNRHRRRSVGAGHGHQSNGSAEHTRDHCDQPYASPHLLPRLFDEVRVGPFCLHSSGSCRFLPGWSWAIDSAHQCGRGDTVRPMTAKVALVTGASRGVGAATAIALAEAGYTVACAARSTAENPQRTPGTIDHVVDQIREAGGTAVAVPTDLSDRQQVMDMVERTVAELGRLDVLVNNAAVTF